MIFLFCFLSILLAIIAAAYLQIPTFLLFLGYGWSHQFEWKRWLFRIGAVIFLVLFLCEQPPLWAILLTLLPFLFFLGLSTMNANPKVFIDLSEEMIIKEKSSPYYISTEVIGFVNDHNQAICYPVQEMVIPRHILNDVWCETPLLISYCAACKSAMVFYPVVNGMHLSFEVIGVYRRNMIMRDRQTGTIWQQATGEAVYGKLKGKQLKYLPYQQTSLLEWSKQYPLTMVAREAENVPKGLFSKEYLMRLLKVTEKIIAPGYTDLEGLPERAFVWGTTLPQGSKAYPLTELEKRNSFNDFIAGVPVKIEYVLASNTIRGWETFSGKPLNFQQHWWFGWKEFHPDTEIWKADT